MAVLQRHVEEKMMPKNVRDFTVPKNLAACADLSYELRAKRLGIGKEVALIKSYETQLNEHLIEHLDKQSASGVSGAVCQAKVTSTPVPTIEDEAKLWRAIKRNPDRYGALVAKPAIDRSVLKEMYEQGTVPPGVGTFRVIKISLTKV